MSKGLKISTFTWDNGIENRNHEELITVLNIQNYFCNAYHSWEKGTVENTIGRIRRFIPKGADISVYSDEYIQKIEDWLNHMPRKCLKYKTPYEIMEKTCALFQLTQVVQLRGKCRLRRIFKTENNLELTQKNHACFETKILIRK